MSEPIDRSRQWHAQHRPLRVERLGYEFQPWRIVSADDLELEHWIEYPGNAYYGLSLPPVLVPYSFRTRREAEKKLGEVNARLDEEARQLGFAGAEQLNLPEAL